MKTFEDLKKMFPQVDLKNNPNNGLVYINDVSAINGIVLCGNIGVSDFDYIVGRIENYLG